MKHAGDFGVREPRGTKGFDAFTQALRDFVTNPAHTRVQGTYRGDPAVLNDDPTSRLVVVQAPDGTFVSGWRMTVAQLRNVISRGSLDGG